MLRRSVGPRARKLTAVAAALLEVDRQRAEEGYRAALALDPGIKEAWFDLGLICKWEGRWDEALECNMRAADLIGIRAQDPVWWNLGIAATAVQNWEVARRAWAAYGLELPGGIGPIEADLGIAPVRINPSGDAEVVWGHRIDPARVRILSVPLPASGHRWADVVLHDGVPNGSREYRGRQHAVFDELERWKPSDIPTVEASVSADDDAGVVELLDEIYAAGYAAEDWTRNIRMLCKRCSEGVVHAEHSDPALASGRERLIGLAGPLGVLAGIVNRWAEESGRHVHSIDRVL